MLQLHSEPSSGMVRRPEVEALLLGAKKMPPPTGDTAGERMRQQLRQMMTRSASASVSSRAAYADGKHMALDDSEEGIMLSTRRYTGGSTSASTTLAGRLPRSRQRSAKRSFTNYWRIIGFQRTQCNSSTAIHAKGSWLIGLWRALAPRRNATTTM